MNQFSQFRGPLIVLTATLAAGVAGYMAIEHWSFFDALFMTVITVTTVGYNEVHPLSRAGEIFTTVLIIVGVGGVLYTLGALFGWVLTIDWPQRRRRRHVEEALTHLQNHFIVCGFGRVGRRVAEVFRHEELPVVVIDVNQNSLAVAEQEGFLTVQGDAASDDVLRRAGITQARGLISAVDSDAENVYVVLSAHELRPDLLIIARANAEDAGTKLKRAGATHVLSPYTTAGQRMAMLAVRPTAVEFVETVLHAGRERLMLEEVVVEQQSSLAHTSLGDLRRRYPSGPVIVALRHDGVLLPSPPDDYCLYPQDTLVLIGTPDNLRRIEGLS